MFGQMGSTLLYLLVFGFSLLFFWLAEGQFNKERALYSGGHYLSNGDANSRRGIGIGTLCAAMGILIVCLFAGMRATSVGSDTQGYPVTFTNAAIADGSFLAFLNDPIGAGDEPLGALLVWICSRFGAGVGPLLFSYQLLTILPVYLAVQRFDGRIPLTVSMAIYLLWFYNNSLNMMRQSVSCALLLLALSIYLARNQIKVSTVVLCVAAALFHRSGAYGAILLVLVLLIARISRRSLRLLLYLAVALFPLVMNRISVWLISSGIADSHMQYYLDIFVNGTVEQDWFVNPLGSYSMTYFLIYTVLILVPWLFNTRLFEPNCKLAVQQRKDGLYQTLRTLNITGYLVYATLLFSLNTMYGMRFSIFFDFFFMLSIPLACRGSLSRQKTVLMVLALIVFWWLWIIRMGWSASGMYVFFFEA